MNSKFLFGLVLLIFLYGCDGRVLERCSGDNAGYGFESIGYIEPLQESYNVGDEVLYTLIIPSTNDYFGRLLDLQQITKVYFARFNMSGFGVSSWLNNNEVTMIKGSRENNIFFIEYNSENNNYELIFKIKYLIPNNYNIDMSRDRIIFDGKEVCNYFEIEHRVQGANEQGFINFTVN